jgi:phospholipase C
VLFRELLPKVSWGFVHEAPEETAEVGRIFKIQRVGNFGDVLQHLFTDSGSTGTNSPLGGFQGRAGYGPRLPLLVISPFAKENVVDHTVTDQSSILRFIEDNWKLGTIGNGSFDALAGSLLNMFDFDHRDESNRRLFLDANTSEPYGF